MNLPETGPLATAAVRGDPLSDRFRRMVAAVSAVETDALAVPSVLMSLCVLVRLVWLTPIEIWGDAGQKWHFARQWAYQNDFRHADWSHHMARFGVNVPVFLVQRLLGTAPAVYFVIPLAAFTLQVLFVYLIALRLGGRITAVFTALCLIFYVGMVRSSSQLLPDGIAGTTLTIAAYLWLRFDEEQGRARLYWLLGVSGAFCWTYAIKESNLFFFPAFALSVWLSRRSFKEAGIFCASVAAYGLLETAWFAHFTDYANRYAIVSNAPEYDSTTFWQLFDRFTKLEPSWQMLIWLWVPSALWLLGRGRRSVPFVIVPFSFLFLLTFLVRHVNPLVPWIGEKSRYLAVIAPFLVLGIGLLLGDLGRGLWAAHRGPRLERAAAWLAPDFAAWAIGLCCVLGLTTYLSAGKSRFLTLTKLRDQVSVLNDAYRRNLPIIDFTPTPRGLRTVYEVFLRDKYLAQADIARKGWLPDVNDAVHRTKLHRVDVAYLLPNTSAYGRNDFAELIAHNCAVVVYLGPHSGLKVQPSQKLPPSCKAPRGVTLAR